MKCTFAVREPNILIEARPGDLFVPLGPDLVECVCALQSIETPSAGFRVDVPERVELDPDALRPVIVMSCRVASSEPEYHPTGFKFYLRGATPIAFVEQVEPAAFRERSSISDKTLDAVCSVSVCDAVMAPPDIARIRNREPPITRL